MCGCDIEFTLTTAHTHFSHSKLGAPDRQRAENNRARFCDWSTTWAAGSRCEAPHMRVNIWRHRDTATWLVWCNYTYIISLRAKCTFSVAVLPPERETVRQGPLWEQGGRASSFAHCSWNLCVHKKDRLLRLEVNVRDNLLCSKGFGEALGAPIQHHVRLNYWRASCVHAFLEPQLAFCVFLKSLLYIKLHLIRERERTMVTCTHINNICW